MAASRRRPAQAAAPASPEPATDAPTPPIAGPLTVQDRPRASIPTADPADPADPQADTVRPMSFADVTELAERGGQIDVYSVEVRGGTDEQVLVPCVLTVNEPWHDSTPRGTRVYPVDDRGKVDQTQPPLGLSVRVAVKTMFGSEVSGTLHTTSAAENRAAAEITRTRGMLRHTLAIPDPEGVSVPLVPVYGSSVNLTAFVRGIDPQEALRIATDALAAAFPDRANLTLRRSQSRPVEDHRVNVFATDGETIAVDVLDAEASYVAARSAYRTVTVPAKAIRGHR